MKIADLFADREVLNLAGKEVEFLIKSDPGLNLPDNLPLKSAIAELYAKLNTN